MRLRDKILTAVVALAAFLAGSALVGVAVADNEVTGYDRRASYYDALGGMLCWSFATVNPNSSANLAATGLFTGIAATDNSSAIVIGSSAPPIFQGVTSTASGNDAYLKTPDVAQLIGDPYLVIAGASEGSTDFRTFFGFAEDQTVLDADDHTIDVAGFSYSTAVPDTNWQFIHNNDSGTTTRVDTGVAYAAATTRKFEVWATGTGSTVYWRISVRDTDALLGRGSVTTNLPTGDNLTVVAGTSNLASAAQTYRVHSMAMGFEFQGRN